jgi:hypothetical protein
MQLPYVVLGQIEMRHAAQKRDSVRNFSNEIEGQVDADQRTALIELCWHLAPRLVTCEGAVLSRGLLTSFICRIRRLMALSQRFACFPGAKSGGHVITLSHP